jgi:glutaminase
MESSGVAFNSFTLNADNKPHNACINAGAIALSGIMYPGLSSAQRFKQLSTEFSRFIGGDKVGFSQSVYLSEKDTAHRNRALAYFMASKGVFPSNVNIDETIDFYLQMCSIEVNSNQLASIAATYANYGNCPLTNERILSFDTVRRTMQLLFSCGMYDYSGRWATTTGLPGKSGVSGCLYVVVPGILGLSIYSPRIAEHGNSVRGIAFAHQITEAFGWNIFDVVYNRQR